MIIRISRSKQTSPRWTAASCSFSHLPCLLLLLHQLGILCKVPTICLYDKAGDSTMAQDRVNSLFLICMPYRNATLSQQDQYPGIMEMSKVLESKAQRNRCEDSEVTRPRRCSGTRL